MENNIIETGLTGQELKNFISFLKDEQEFEKTMHEARMEVVQKEHDGLFEKHIDGMGQCIGIMDQRTFHRWNQMDEGFWRDSKNVRKFINENPEYRVHNKRV